MGDFKRRATNRAIVVSMIPASEMCFHTSFSQRLLMQHTLSISDAILIVIMLELSPKMGSNFFVPVIKSVFSINPHYLSPSKAAGLSSQR